MQAGSASSHFPLTHPMISLPFKVYPGSQVYFTTRPPSNKNTSPCSGAVGAGHGIFGEAQKTKKNREEK